MNKRYTENRRVLLLYKIYKVCIIFIAYYVIFTTLCETLFIVNKSFMYLYMRGLFVKTFKIKYYNGIDSIKTYYNCLSIS